MTLQEQIAKLKEDFNNKLSSLEKQIQKEKESPKFKENDWITNGSELGKFKSYGTNTIYLKESYNKDGEDYGSDNSITKDYNIAYWRLATNSEIEEILVAVAKKKGFVNTRFISTTGTQVFEVKDKIKLFYEGANPFNYNLYAIGQDDQPHGLIYENKIGKWAEIIKKDEFPVILGHKGKSLGNQIVKYGCKEFSLVYLRNLYNEMKTIEAKSITISEGTIKLEEIQQVINVLKK